MDMPPPQIVCIAQAVYAEARGESELGRRAVAHVILNRSRQFNKTPCIVLRQPGQFQINLTKKHSGKDWKKAMEIARHPGKDPTGGATYFRHRKCHGKWNLRITTSIGNHNFYK